MLFRRLLEFQQSVLRSPAVTRGLAISAVAHTVFVGGWIATSRDLRQERPQPAETFTPVEFFVPPDRLVALRPQQEKVTWTSLEPGSGHGFQEEAAPQRDEEKLEVVVAKGEEKEVEAAPPDLETRPPIELGDSIMTEYQVDTAVVRYDNAAAPLYPPDLLKRRIEGTVIVQYVVDTTGYADTSTFRVISATHNGFVKAVREVLPLMRFRPAFMGDRRVAQLVQQPFAFRIIDTSTVARDRRPPPG
jgi:TonB family protein